MNGFDPTQEAVDLVPAGDREWTVDDLSDGPVAAVEAEAEEEAAREGGVREVRVLKVAGARAEAAAGLEPVIAAAAAAPTRRGVSGRYLSEGRVQVELRVDVDGRRPTRRVSGDLFVRSGSTLHYDRSFVVHAPRVTTTTTRVVIEGVGRFSSPVAAPRVRVTIPRVPPTLAPAAATLDFLTTAGGQPSARFTCAWQSEFFRTVQLEEDQVQGVVPFAQYNTGTLAAPPPARTLSVVNAYVEAGVQVLPAGVSNVVPTAGIGAAWDNAELHNAMVQHFSLWRDTPQWKVWLLTADLHALGPGLHGIMFDQQGRQRQGCAVFHRGIGGAAPGRQRRQLYTCVHELGHCFNLYHSFHKQFMTPPQPNRPGALSWMNYPDNYQPSFGPGGEAAFWPAFPFQFDEPELVHLRHGFRDDVIFGGNPFGTGAALEDAALFADPLADESGLRVELRGRTSYALGEPVVCEIKLERTDLRGKEVNPLLHPNFGYVQIGIRHPSGRVVVYKPALEHCMMAAPETLCDTRPAVYDSAYIGYGKDGLYFDAPGQYQLRAVYLAPDGSRIASNIFSVRIRSPLSVADDEVAERYLGDEQGMLFYLLGSDAPSLESGRAAMADVLERHPTHPLATYARLVEGRRFSREFKTIGRDNVVRAREPDLTAAAESLQAAVNDSRTGERLDNITLSQTWLQLAGVKKESDGAAAAEQTAKQMLAHFRPRVNERVLGTLEVEVRKVLEGDDYEAEPLA